MKIALVGEPRARGFASLRLRHFETVLAGEGHDLVLVDAAAPPVAVDADVVVSAGIHGPTQAALALAGERPLWVDLPGDAFADAQAVALRRPAEAQAVLADAARVFIPALCRADGISAVSEASASAILGQLGLLGRWAEVPVHAVPIAWPGTRPKPPREPGPLRVLLAGSFNTWFDEDAVIAVLTALPQAEVVVLGGPGQPGGFDRFRDVFPKAQNHGWVADPEPIAQRCDVLLSLDVPGIREPRFGSRTRALWARSLGLRVVASSGPELIDRFPDQFGAVSNVQDARRLLVEGPNPDVQCLAEAFEPARVLRPLVDWLRTPRRLLPAQSPVEALKTQLVAAEGELRDLRASVTFRIGQRLRFRS